MFAIVRTGGKQYRVAPGDKIVVEKLAGNAGDSVDLTDVLLAGEGSDLKSTDGLVVAAEIIAQPDVDGALVGGASLDPDGFARIVAAAAA